MRVAVKLVGEPLKIVATHKKYRGDCVKEYIGKDEYIEYLRLSEDGTLSLAANENGLPMELPANFLLSTTSPYFPIQVMVGTIVFVRTKYVNVWEKEIWDYEVEDLTDEDIKCIENILAPERQAELKKRFVDYGTGYAVVEAVDIPKE